MTGIQAWAITNTPYIDTLTNPRPHLDSDYPKNVQSTPSGEPAGTPQFDQHPTVHRDAPPRVCHLARRAHDPHPTQPLRSNARNTKHHDQHPARSPHGYNRGHLTQTEPPGSGRPDCSRRTPARINLNQDSMSSSTTPAMRQPGVRHKGHPRVPAHALGRPPTLRTIVECEARCLPIGTFKSVLVIEGGGPRSRKPWPRQLCRAAALGPGGSGPTCQDHGPHSTVQSQSGQPN
jgi:hypothetical protein